ncbi:MAG: hypothetical protein AN485_22535, partial [Anabaena sp. MDT14b]
QNGTAPRGDHALLRLRQLVDHLLLLIPETVLALAGKKLPDRAAQAVLDLMVGIDKRLAKTARQLAANGGFARAGKAHKDDAQRKSLAEKNQRQPPSLGFRVRGLPVYSTWLGALPPSCPTNSHRQRLH